MIYNLAKNIDELSSITGHKNLVQSWSGAVAFLIIKGHFVFIQRSNTMPTHKGQIGFMGGHKKEVEKDPIVTAIREFKEESNLGNDLNIHGLLKPVVTSKGNSIIPVVCELDMDVNDFLKEVLSNGEWDNLILCPIDYLKNMNLWSKGSYVKDKEYPVYFAPLPKTTCKYLNHSDRSFVLWGASAKMVLSFYSCLSCDK